MRSLVALILMLAPQFASQPQPASGISGQFLLHAKPASGVPIMAVRQGDGGPAGGVAGIATTDASGNYRIPLSPGNYYIRTANGPITYYPGVPALTAATPIVVENGKFQT